MDNDTATDGTDESHVPFIPKRNAAADSSVLPDMDNTTNTYLTPSDIDPDIDEVADASGDLTGSGEPTASTAGGTTSAETAQGSGDFAPTTQEFPMPPAQPTEAPFVYDTPNGPQTESAPIVTPPITAPAGVAAATSAGNRNDGVMYFIGAVVAAILGSLLTIGVLSLTGGFDDPAPPIVESAPPVTIVETNQPQIINDVGSGVNPTAIAQRVLPSIVTVNVFEGGSPEDNAIATGSGSGVVMSTDGYIITNNHVIESADSVTVTFQDNRQYEATLVGSDELTDLAVLRIDAAGLVPIEFGSSDALSIGDPAVAVGNPLGQSGGASISAGIISAFDRRVDFADSTTLFGMIQTDAAINSGSSGGALVNADGDLIGITSAIGVSTAGPEGIGYAIPVELVDRITNEIIETGDVEHPFLGVDMITFFDEQPDGAVVPSGALIDSILGAETAAGIAGLEPGDIIIGIEGEEITSQSDLALAVRLFRVGDTITFTVDRNGETLDFDVTLRQRPAEFQG